MPFAHNRPFINCTINTYTHTTILCIITVFVHARVPVKSNYVSRGRRAARLAVINLSVSPTRTTGKIRVRLYQIYVVGSNDISVGRAADYQTRTSEYDAFVFACQFYVFKRPRNVFLNLNDIFYAGLTRLKM